MLTGDQDGIVGSAADEGGSAISERDVHMSNKHAMHTQPEAPRPVIGMNDERGAVRIPLPPSLIFSHHQTEHRTDKKLTETVRDNQRSTG